MHNINKFNNTNIHKPEWAPDVPYSPSFQQKDIKKLIYAHYDRYSIYIIDNFLSFNACEYLISDFIKQEKYPVGVNGYINPEESPGSYRAMAWSESLAEKFSLAFKNIIEETSIFLNPKEKYKGMAIPERYSTKVNLLGSTPWMRFMQYVDGGKHVPHYDCSYINQEESYLTLFSWILYLNTPEGTGGEFQFVNDSQGHIHPSLWDRSDWNGMSATHEFSVEPKGGRMLIFPHHLCHQVAEFNTYTGYRAIVRGDIAYGL